MATSQTNYYIGPPANRVARANPASAALAGPINHPLITVDGLEVTQVIQNMNHDVPLIAGKPTIVRAYLSTSDAHPWNLEGKLLVTPMGPTGPLSTPVVVPSLLNGFVDPAENTLLRLKRENLNRSITFRLPESLLAAGTYLIQLLKVFPVGDESLGVFPPSTERTIQLINSPPMRVHVVGMRYRTATGGPTFTPMALDFNLLRSWLLRAYPVSDVFWTQTVVDYPNNTDTFDPTADDSVDPVNAFLSTIRADDVLNGTDKRTHYYGFVSDGGGFMRGKATGIPGSPDPTIVASGPTGPSGGWDTDGSYGDWYGGHELGHTYGRSHAPFCGAGGGLPYPFPAGQLSTNDGAFVGFDVGDPLLGIPMAALPGVTWHDVMTYCDFQWLSSFTYNGIRDRLVATEALSAGPPAPPSGGTGGAATGGAVMALPSTIHVVAQVNRTKGTGKFLQVNPSASAINQAKNETVQYTLRALKADGTKIQEFSVGYRPYACKMDNEDESGSVDVVIPNGPDYAALELLDGAKVLDRFAAGGTPAIPKNIRSGTATGGPVVAAAAAPQQHGPTIKWDAPAAAAGLALGAGSPEKYKVQVSLDAGKTWKTIGLGLTSPNITLDQEMIAGATEVQVKVTSSNGFQSQSTTQKFSPTDLK